MALVLISARVGDDAGVLFHGEEVLGISVALVRRSIVPTCPEIDPDRVVFIRRGRDSAANRSKLLSPRLEALDQHRWTSTACTVHPPCAGVAGSRSASTHREAVHLPNKRGGAGTVPHAFPDIDNIHPVIQIDVHCDRVPHGSNSRSAET